MSSKAVQHLFVSLLQACHVQRVPKVANLREQESMAARCKAFRGCKDAMQLAK